MSVKYEYEYNADGTIKVVKITNTTTGTPTPTTGDITVTKSFSGVDALPADFRITNSYDEQVFTVANATGTNPYTWTLSGIADGTTVTFTESGTTVNGYDLEVSANGTVVSGFTVSASVVAGETVTAALVNTYSPKTVSVTLKKVDKDDVNNTNPDLLKGAAFTLSKYLSEDFRGGKDETWGDSGSKSLADTKNPDETYTLNGIFTFDGLTEGFYQIEETAFPSGYVQMTSKPTFKVMANDSNELEITLLNNPDNLLQVVEGELTIMVGNTPGVALPNTGGPGTGLIYLIGLMLTAFAGAGLVMKKRRRNAA